MLCGVQEIDIDSLRQHTSYDVRCACCAGCAQAGGLTRA
jgi:hypothetical protein